MVSLKKSYIRLVLFLFLAMFFGIYSLISIRSHDLYLTFAWDLGYFDQLIWMMSRFFYPLSTLSKINLLAGHFTPILAIYVPLYWLWSNVKILLIAQSFLMIFAGWFLYDLCYVKTKNNFFSFAVLVSYLLFLGTQWSILNEFHEATIIPMLIALNFWAIEKKNKILLFLSLVLIILTKEEMALLAASLGLVYLFRFKMKRFGIAVFILSLIYFFLMIFTIMPGISEQGVFYQGKLSMDTQTPMEFFLKFKDPIFLAKSLVTPVEKINVLFTTFLSFGLIPLLSPISLLIPIAQQFFMRFVYTGPQFTFWQNINHHAAPIAMLMPIASIYAAYRISKIPRLKKTRILTIAGLMLFVSTFVQDVYFKAPIHSFFKKQLYENPPWVDDISEMIRLIPKTASVATQNNIFPHLSHRKEIYLLPEINNAEYILVSLNDIQNSYSPMSKQEMQTLVGELKESENYFLALQKGYSLLFKSR